MPRVQTRNLLGYTLGVHLGFLASLVLLCIIMLSCFYMDYNAFFRTACKYYVWDPASITAFSLGIYVVLISVACVVCHTRLPILAITLRIMSSLAILVVHVLLLTQVLADNALGLLCVTFWWYAFELSPYVILGVLVYFVLVRCNSVLSPVELRSRGVSAKQLTAPNFPSCSCSRRSARGSLDGSQPAQSEAGLLSDRSERSEWQTDEVSIGLTTGRELERRVTPKRLHGAPSSAGGAQGSHSDKAADSEDQGDENQEATQETGGSDHGQPSMSEDSADLATSTSNTLSGKKPTTLASMWRGVLDDLDMDFDTGAVPPGTESHFQARPPHDPRVVHHCNVYVQISLCVLVAVLDIVFYAGFGHPGYYGDGMAIRTLREVPTLVAERVAPSIMPDMSRISVDRLFTIMDLRALELDVLLTADCGVVCAKSAEVSALNGRSDDKRLLSDLTQAEAMEVETGGLWATEDPYDTLARGLYSRALVEECRATRVESLRGLLYEVIKAHNDQFWPEAPLELLLDIRDDEPEVRAKRARRLAEEHAGDAARGETTVGGSGDESDEECGDPDDYDHSCYANSGESDACGQPTRVSRRASPSALTTSESAGAAPFAKRHEVCQPGQKNTITGPAALTAICVILRSMPMPSEISVSIICHSQRCVTEAWDLRAECGFSRVVAASSVVPTDLREEKDVCYYESIRNLRLVSQSDRCVLIRGPSDASFIRYLWKTGATAIQTVSPHVLAEQGPVHVTIVGGGVFLFLMALHVAAGVFIVLWDVYMNPRLLAKRVSNAGSWRRPPRPFSITEAD